MISSILCSSSSCPARPANSRDSLAERANAIKRSIVTPMKATAIINKTSATPLLRGAIVLQTCAKLKLIASLQKLGKKCALGRDPHAEFLEPNDRDGIALSVVGRLVTL